MKIGRRGSMNFRIMVTGVQGHVAYPQKAENPIPVLARLLTRLAAKIDGRNAHFDPSILEMITVDVGNLRAMSFPPGAARVEYPLQCYHTPGA